LVARDLELSDHCPQDFGVIFKVLNTILKPIIDVAGFEAILAHEN